MNTTYTCASQSVTVVLSKKSRGKHVYVSKRAYPERMSGECVHLKNCANLSISGRANLSGVAAITKEAEIDIGHTCAASCSTCSTCAIAPVHFFNQAVKPLAISVVDKQAKCTSSAHLCSRRGALFCRVNRSEWSLSSLSNKFFGACKQRL